MESITETRDNEPKESIKIIRNSKGYNWEIRVLPVVGNKLSEADFERLRGFNAKAQEEYGSVT